MVSAAPARPPPAAVFPVALRHAVRVLEGRRHETLDPAAGLRPFGITPLDEALGGGLAYAALHEIVAANETEAAAAAGFTLALAAGFAAASLAAAGRPASASRAVLWIAEEMSQHESGLPYGPGLDAVGLAPEALLLVRAAHPRDVLWAMEEALRCRAVGAVVGEIRKADGVDGVASRRLSLAATREQRPALLLRPRPEILPAAAATRWSIGAAPSAAQPGSGPGPPRFAVQLVRNRHGRFGSWILEWNRAEHRLAPAPALSQPVAAQPLDRPHSAAVA
jgi:protein ImuA